MRAFRCESKYNDMMVLDKWFNTCLINSPGAMAVSVIFSVTKNCVLDDFSSAGINSCATLTPYNFLPSFPFIFANQGNKATARISQVIRLCFFLKKILLMFANWFKRTNIFYDPLNFPTQLVQTVNCTWILIDWDGLCCFENYW